jgi:hypothetical protein
LLPKQNSNKITEVCWEILTAAFGALHIIWQSVRGLIALVRAKIKSQNEITPRRPTR